MLQHQEIDSENQADLEAIRRRLSSRNVAVRTAANQELSGVPATDLIKLIEMENQHRAKRKKWLIVGVTVYFLLAVALMAVAHSGQFFTMFGSFTGVFAAAMAFSQAHKGAATALAQYDDIAGVGAMVEALEIPDAEVQIAVRQGLTRLLPRLRASDAALLSPSGRRMLRKAMVTGIGRGRPYRSIHAPVNAALIGPRFRDNGRVEFIVATLKGLEQVGDESFIETVDQMARGEGVGSDERVRLAANECLPFLKQRAENERLRHDLLRAASGNGEAGSEELLRAAESIGHTEPDQLLRPAGN